MASKANTSKVSGNSLESVTRTAAASEQASQGDGAGRMRRRFQHARNLDSAVDFVKAATADQKLPDGPRPPLRMGGPACLIGFSETFVTGVMSQAIVNTHSIDSTGSGRDPYPAPCETRKKL